MQNITGSTRVSANFHVSNHRRPRNTKNYCKAPSLWQCGDETSEEDGEDAKHEDAGSDDNS